jgi:predicted O-methyltransferase YrrM
MLYQYRNSTLPWLTKDANNFLSEVLSQADVGLEFGGGRSTIWFAKRVQKIVTVEHNEQWYKVILGKIEESKLSNVDCRSVQVREEDTHAMGKALNQIYADFPNEYFDFILVDGIGRDACAVGALGALKPGGLLIIDNVNRHLPSQSRSPHSRSVDMGPEGALWLEFQEKTKKWRRYWTSSGVTDTAIYFKPAR